MKPAFQNLWSRILAFLLDYLPVGGYVLVVIAVGSSLYRMFPDGSRRLISGPVSGELVGLLAMTLPISLYFALGESSQHQATWGKRKIGLHVTKTNGAPLSRARALWRTALKFVPWELAHSCLWQIRFHQENPSPLIFIALALVWVLVGANIVSLLVSKSNQTLYDWLSDTVVLKV